MDEGKRLIENRNGSSKSIMVMSETKKHCSKMLTFESSLSNNCFVSSCRLLSHLETDFKSPE